MGATSRISVSLETYEQGLVERADSAHSPVHQNDTDVNGPVGLCKVEGDGHIGCFRDGGCDEWMSDCCCISS